MRKHKTRAHLMLEGVATMSNEENKILLRRFYDEVFVQGKLEVLDEICAPNYRMRGSNVPPGMSNDREGLRQIVMLYRRGVPDLQFRIDDIIAEDDRVA